MKKKMRRVAVSGLVFAAIACAGAAYAGRVEATAGSVSDIQSGPTSLVATATEGTLSASTTRNVGTAIMSSGVGAFIDPSIAVNTRATSEFTVFGLNGIAPLTFHWTFSGNRTWNPDNAYVGIQLSAGLNGDGPTFIDNVVWGISYVDGPVNQGDFAGVLASFFRVDAAGFGFANAIPPDIWDGQGVREASSTMLFASNGSTGIYELEVRLGFAGHLTAAYGLSLSSVTVPDLAQLGSNAHLLLDNGNMVAITAAVPEAETWAMLVAGLLVVSSLARRRS